MKPATILVVDDETMIRDVIRVALTKAGYRVVVAASGGEALAHASVQTFDAVLTDMLMPETDGFQLIKKLRVNQPQIRVIAMSGGVMGSRNHFLDTAVGWGAHITLGKPFTLSELTNTVKAVLASDGAEAANARTAELNRI